MIQCANMGILPDLWGLTLHTHMESDCQLYTHSPLLTVPGIPPETPNVLHLKILTFTNVPRSSQPAYYMVRETRAIATKTWPKGAPSFLLLGNKISGDFI